MDLKASHVRPIETAILSHSPPLFHLEAGQRERLIRFITTGPMPKQRTNSDCCAAQSKPNQIPLNRLGDIKVALLTDDRHTTRGGNISDSFLFVPPPLAITELFTRSAPTQKCTRDLERDGGLSFCGPHWMMWACN